MSGGDELAGMFAAEDARAQKELAALRAERDAAVAMLNAEPGGHLLGCGCYGCRVGVENTRLSDGLRAAYHALRLAAEQFRGLRDRANEHRLAHVAAVAIDCAQQAEHAAVIVKVATSDKQAIRQPPRTTADEYAAAHDLADPSRAE